MTLTVVVPVYNGAAELGVCLKALAESSVAAEEIIVVDDGSTDSSAAVAGALGARVLRNKSREGPAVARNRGAKQAKGDVLVFVDADVALHVDALERMKKLMAEDEELAAVMGSYDEWPLHLNFFSQYKNLQHVYMHEEGAGLAETFWAGCGAMRRDVFVAHGGFDERYKRASIEDIELGLRLTRGGCRIELHPEVKGQHRRHYSFLSMVKSDIYGRALPWAELIWRTGRLPSSLNLGMSQRISGALVLGAVAALGSGYVFAGTLALALAGGLNTAYYNFLAQRRSWWFAARAVPVHLLYFAYSTVAFVAAGLRRGMQS